MTLFRVGALLRCRMQRQLLYAPTQQLADIERILAGAGDLVDPRELALRPAAASDGAQKLAVERELVNAARISIGRVQHLVWTRGNADGPRRARKLRLVRRIRVRWIADDRLRAGRCIHIDGDDALHLAGAVEHLNAPV